jgi:hypothetical protein
MTLRLGVDLDGVLADMESELISRAEELFGEAMARRLRESAAEPPAASAGDPPTDTTPPENSKPLINLRMTSRQQRRLWQHVQSIENFWMGLRELEPGIVARLASTASERRWEIIFLTKRPETAGATAQVQSQRWLEAHGFSLPSVFVVQGSRGRIAAALALDIVVDDRPENCLDVVVDSKARAILVWRDDERLLPAAAHRLGIGTVKSVAECLDILTQVDAAGNDQPGMMSRVRKLLGLNEPARA